MTERCYPNLIGVFSREFPLVCARVTGTARHEYVTWHEQRYRVAGDPRGNGSRYAFDVFLCATAGR